MNRYSLATICLMAAGLACLSRTAHADGFEAVGLRALARELAIGLGPGYHAKPCIKHQAQHYDHSLQGTIHPAHRLTPLYCLNKSNAVRHRGVRCQSVPNPAAPTMPTLYRHLPSPTTAAPGVQPMPFQPIWQPSANGPAPSYDNDEAIDSKLDEVDESDQSSVHKDRVIDETEEAETDELERPDLETRYRIKRLPSVDLMNLMPGDVTPVRDVNVPVVDGSQFEDVELPNNATEPDDVWDPLKGQPLWEENGPAQPRL